MFSLHQGRPWLLPGQPMGRSKNISKIFILKRIFIVIFQYKYLLRKYPKMTPEAAASCDPDYGWINGPDGTDKCYMVLRVK